MMTGDAPLHSARCDPRELNGHALDQLDSRITLSTSYDTITPSALLPFLQTLLLLLILIRRRLLLAQLMAQC